MSDRVLPAADAFWRPSNQLGVLNTDLAKQLGADTLGARLWRLRPGQASTRHRHRATKELYVVLEGIGRIRIGDVLHTLEPMRARSSSPTPSASCSTTPIPISCGWSSARRPRARTRSR